MWHICRVFPNSSGRSVRYSGSLLDKLSIPTTQGELDVNCATAQSNTQNAGSF